MDSASVSLLSFLFCAALVIRVQLSCVGADYVLDASTAHHPLQPEHWNIQIPHYYSDVPVRSTQTAFWTHQGSILQVMGFSDRAHHFFFLQMIEIYSIGGCSLRSSVMFVWNRTFTEGGEARKTAEWLLNFFFLFFFKLKLWVDVRKICSNTKAQRVLKIKKSN